MFALYKQLSSLCIFCYRRVPQGAEDDTHFGLPVALFLIYSVSNQTLLTKTQNCTPMKAISEPCIDLVLIGFGYCHSGLYSKRGTMSLFALGVSRNVSVPFYLTKLWTTHD